MPPSMYTNACTLIAGTHTRGQWREAHRFQVLPGRTCRMLYCPKWFQNFPALCPKIWDCWQMRIGRTFPEWKDYRVKASNVTMYILRQLGDMEPDLLQLICLIVRFWDHLSETSTEELFPPAFGLSHREVISARTACHCNWACPKSCAISSALKTRCDQGPQRSWPAWRTRPF